MFLMMTTSNFQIFWWWRPQIPKFRPKIGLTKCSFQTIQKLGMLWMMTASNLTISASNWPHKVLLSVHMGCSGWWRPQIGKFRPKIGLTEGCFESILKLGLFWMMTASNWEVSAENRLTEGCFEYILELGLFRMMTASNWEVSAENRPHKGLL